MPAFLSAIAHRILTARWISILLLLSAAQAIAAETPESFKFTKIDLELWDKVNQVDRELERNGLVFDDPDAVAYIEEVGMKMVPQAPLEKVAWRFRILRAAEPNAFALPNGSIYVHTGLLSMLRNEAQLASVLGHEVTHVMNRHSYLENRSYRKKMATANVLSAIGGVAGPVGGIAGVTISTVLQSLVPGVLLATIYGYSRELEHEADMYGLRAMARNNYPLIQMAATFEQLKAGAEVQLEKEAHGLYTDHPRLDDRIKYVSEMVDKLPLSGTPVVRVNEYNKQMERVFRHDISLQILTGRARTALVIATRLTDANPENSEDAFLLGESYRALGGRTARPRPEELTDSGKSATRKQLGKLTLLEYEASLRKTPEGQAAWVANVKSAETAYKRALTLDPQNARAVRGLAALYAEDGRTAEALDGYRKYLQMAPTAMDAYRIKKRTEDLEKSQAANTATSTTRN
jgi:beta-barrel assembly-enhancing protease